MRSFKQRRHSLLRLVPLLPLLAVAACSTGKPSYVVFFEERSAQLDGKARGVVAAAAARAKQAPDAPIEVIGYTDSAGSASADVALSQQRAKAVADGLVASGVDPSRLQRKGKGQTGEDPGVASRRVEIAVDNP